MNLKQKVKSDRKRDHSDYITSHYKSMSLNLVELGTRPFDFD